MDYWSIVGGAIFVVLGCAIYFGRKKITVTGRIAMFTCMAALATAIIYRADSLERANEKVWDTDAPQWSQGPLTIGWDRTQFVPYNQTFDAAIKTWNGRISCEVYRFVSDPNNANVRIHTADGTKCGHETINAVIVEEKKNSPAFAFYCNGYVDVQFKTLDDTGLAFRVALHEMGHGLGLTHDDRGAMAENAVEPQMGDYPEYLLPSEKDVAALKERFCK